jgi:hypothetical protein
MGISDGRPTTYCLVWPPRLMSEVTSYIVSPIYAFMAWCFTFKWLMFAYYNAHKKHPYEFILCTLFTLARWGLLLKFGAEMCEVVLNLHMKCQTRQQQTASLWAGPFEANQRSALPNHMSSVRFWDIQHRVVIPYRHFGITCRSQLQGSKNSKERIEHDGS